MNKKESICKVYKNGNKEWWLNGKLHREDGPAIERPNGSKYWYLNGELHREDGPAVECANSHKRWYLNGKLHREDGPAVEWPDGNKYWWLNSIEYTKQEYYRELVQKGICTEQEAFIELL
jgi:antitoxin component YwqK of YwqJK toxin-antitoxin module